MSNWIAVHSLGSISDFIEVAERWGGWFLISAIDSDPDTLEIVVAHIESNSSVQARNVVRLGERAVVNGETLGALSRSGLFTGSDEIWHSRCLPTVGIPPEVWLRDQDRAVMPSTDELAALDGTTYDCAMGGGFGTLVWSLEDFFEKQLKEHIVLGKQPG